MPNSWKHFENCVDLKHPMVQKGKTATYRLILKDENLESRKIDADEVKRKKAITHKIGDAFFFIWQKDSGIREKVIVVETKGADFSHAIEQLAACYKMLMFLKIEIVGRIIASKIPASIKIDKEYQALQKLYSGQVKRRSQQMTETFVSFEQSTIE